LRYPVDKNETDLELAILYACELGCSRLRILGALGGRLDQTLANLFQFAFMVLCAPFFPFAALPDWLRTIARLIPLSYGVDAFRSTLMGYPRGFPELAPIGVEVAIVTTFGLLMPVIGFWLYRREENIARRKGSLSEY